jgi:aminoglycoside phosphotransferase (APT) family kinase protein
MENVYHWLQANLPQTTTFSLVHNDYKLDNVMLASDDPGRIVAIFDWDMCTLGDPLSDVGSLLTYWMEPADQAQLLSLSMMPTGDWGFLSRNELIDRYAERSGRSVENIHFYHTLGLFRLAVIAAQIYIRYVRGQTQDPRFASIGPSIPRIAQAAQAVALA